MKRIGLIPMSAKPYHAGHDALIRLAAAECDEVVVLVSTADRARKGEHPIKGETMRKLWEDQIVWALPTSVIVQFVPNPVGALYTLAGDSDKDAANQDSYLIYSDPTDMDRNFPVKSVAKYMPRLVAERRVMRRLVPRETTVDVSGTQMRGWLQHNDKARFLAHLPPSLDGEAVWSALTSR